MQDETEQLTYQSVRSVSSLLKNSQMVSVFFHSHKNLQSQSLCGFNFFHHLILIFLKSLKKMHLNNLESASLLCVLKTKKKLVTGLQFYG